MTKTYSKTYPKGYEITDDALIFIKDTLQKITEENSVGHRKFKLKTTIIFKITND